MLDDIYLRARRMYDERRRRTELFPPTFLSDHAWDILLWIFIETGQGRPVTAEDASKAAMISTPVGNRWIAALGEAGLIVVHPIDRDRRHHVTLSDGGYRNMETYLRNMG